MAKDSFGLEPESSIDPDLLPYLEAADQDEELSLAELQEKQQADAANAQQEENERLDALRHLVANSMLPGVSVLDGGVLENDVAAASGELGSEMERLAALDELLADVDTDDWEDWDEADSYEDEAEPLSEEEAHQAALRAAAQQVEISERMRQVEAEILSRAPEHQVQPSLERVEAVLDILGNPERSYRVVHLTGTNGKTSTARMVETMLTSAGIRTGRFTSPHLATIRERISLDGQPISEEGFIAAWEDVAPYIAMVDANSVENGGPRMSFFEVLTVMALATFADHPVDVAVIEVGMGGRWDATNVVQSEVEILTPIARDHMRWLGNSLTEIAREKAGIIKPGATVISAAQAPEVWAEIAAAAAEQHAIVRHELADDADPDAPDAGELSVVEREVAVGGQMVTLRTAAAVYEDVFVPLHGEYQAHNALLALAAVEALFAGRQVPAALVEDGFAAVTSPGRLEVLRSSPTVMVDAAHNPHGVAALREAIEEVFPLEHLVAVVGVMADKDAEGILAELEPACDAVVCVPVDSPRAMDVEDLAQIAREVFTPEQVSVADRLLDGVERALSLAEGHDGPLANSGIVVVGSVVLAAEARELFGKR